MSLLSGLSSHKKGFIILKHIGVWLVILLLPYLMQLSFESRFRMYRPPLFFFYWDTATKLLWVLVFYLNAYLLAPLFIYKKKYVLYGLIILGLLILVALLNNFFQHFVMQHFSPAKGPGGPRFMRIERGMALGSGPKTNIVAATRAMPASGPNFFISITFNLAPYFLTLAASVAYRMIKDKASTEAADQDKQRENLKTELSFLRSQISPHFMFNVLNNITALARLKSDELEPTIIKLSSLMRYMLYETNAETVLLTSETEYLQSYIDLQLQRFGKLIKVTVLLEQPEKEFKIEPMLLIPFVENAFKHGAAKIKAPEINIHLSAKNNVLKFEVKNKYQKNSVEVQDKDSGIGLTNVQRRLSLLYQKDHELKVLQQQDEEDNYWFTISLQIKLHS